MHESGLFHSPPFSRTERGQLLRISVRVQKDEGISRVHLKFYPGFL
jgi:hypothetical protein